jgi:hypothetical protein
MLSSPRGCCSHTIWGSRWLPFSNSFTFSMLPCRFTLTYEFVLRQLLNHDRMNKLSQLSVSVSFTFRVTCMDLFPYMLPKISLQSMGACLPCSPVSIVSRNRSGAAKPQWGLNGLCFSIAISAHRRWVVVSIYGLSSTMCCHVLGFGYLVLYLLFLNHLYFLLFFTYGFLPHFLVGFCSLFYTWKDWSAPSCSLS